MGFIEAVKSCFRNYVNFNGRARRSEFWFFFLFQVIIYFLDLIFFIFCLISAVKSANLDSNYITSINLMADGEAKTQAQLELLGKLLDANGMLWLPIIIFVITWLGLFIPNISVAFRRLHDTGKPGWLYFLSFTSYISILLYLASGIFLLVMYVLDSQPGYNKYGPNPKDPLDPSPQGNQGGNGFGATM